MDLKTLIQVGTVSSERDMAGAKALREGRELDIRVVHTLPRPTLPWVTSGESTAGSSTSTPSTIRSQRVEHWSRPFIQEGKRNSKVRQDKDAQEVTLCRTASLEEISKSLPRRAQLLLESRIRAENPGFNTNPAKSKLRVIRDAKGNSIPIWQATSTLGSLRPEHSWHIAGDMGKGWQEVMEDCEPKRKKHEARDRHAWKKAMNLYKAQDRPEFDGRRAHVSEVEELRTRIDNLRSELYAVQDIRMTGRHPVSRDERNLMMSIAHLERLIQDHLENHSEQVSDLTSSMRDTRISY
jgi:hypothetical protein